VTVPVLPVPRQQEPQPVLQPFVQAAPWHQRRPVLRRAAEPALPVPQKMRELPAQALHSS
jgi:hypothetical protein